jgi:RNase adapter protein RapZ
MTEFVLIAGMSGAGRSTAAAALEDAGWYVIDNMPPSLLAEAAQVVASPDGGQERVALVIGRGGGARPREAVPAIEGLKAQGHRVRVVYLDAPRDVLVRRFEGTRRRHPIAGDLVEEAIEDERQMLQPLRDRADIVIDTGDLNINQLRIRVMELLGEDSGVSMRTSVMSFGYKHGVPLDADLVFDCRFLPNPHWIEELRPLSGLDAPVRDYVMSHEATGAFLGRVDELVSELLPAYAAEGKSYLTIALGCTGGRHRSVVLAEELARCLSVRGVQPTIFHRDLDR